LGRKIASGAASLVVGLAPWFEARADAPCARLDAPRAALPIAWERAVEDLERQLQTLPGADCQSMTLSVEPGEGGVRVVAVTTDGRRAERAVREPRALVATALGLVMAIPGNTAAPALPAEPSPRPPATVPAQVEPHVVNPVLPQPREPDRLANRPSAVWLGFAVGGRVASPTSILTLDIEAYANVLLGHWLLIASIRDVPTGLVAAQGIDEDAFREVSAGLGFGRRVVAGDAAIDVAVLPALVAMQMEYDFPPGTVPSSVHGGDVEFGLDAMARLALPVSKSWVLTLAIDADVLPGNVASPTRLDTPQGITTRGLAAPPPFPTLTSGVRIGASGALL
jgi:hypothetical protein